MAYGATLAEVKFPLKRGRALIVDAVLRGKPRFGLNFAWVKGMTRYSGVRPLLDEVEEMFGARTVSMVPLIARQRPEGVMLFLSPEKMTPSEQDLIEAFASQAAIAIENARLYERVKRHAEELEHLVEERTRELQAIQAELQRSSKLAALGQLAAGVAHELNNPLGAISGYLELLSEEAALGGRELDYLDRIEKGVQQAAKIVERLQHLGIPSEPVRVLTNVNDVLEQSLHLVEQQLKFHHIRILKDLEPNLPLIRADPDQLEEVFLNLIHNSRQAMPEGGELKVTTQERGEEWVEITFADTGQGIADQHLDRIFDPFFTTRAPGQGMGLGLSLSYRIIRSHGGAIDVWSRRGRGSVFRILSPTPQAKKCWEIFGCGAEGECKAPRETADYRCWSVVEAEYCQKKGHGLSGCEDCEVRKVKAVPPLDEGFLPPGG